RGGDEKETYWPECESHIRDLSIPLFFASHLPTPRPRQAEQADPKPPYADAPRRRPTDSRSLRRTPTRDAHPVAARGGRTVSVDRVRHAAPPVMRSNNGPLRHALVVELLPDVATRFDQLCFSYQVGALKPDPQAYVRTLERLGVKPAQSMFVDDVQENVEGARAAGIDAVRFVSAEALAEQLQERGLI